MERAALARMIDHSVLRPDITAGQIAMACGQVDQLGVAALCVLPARLPLPPGALLPEIATCTVIGFPWGSHRTAVKCAEATQAVEDGATELDVVIDLAFAAAGLWGEVQAQLAAVRAAVPEAVVMKAILETAFLETREKIVAACGAAEAAGFDFVKTSTGFHPAGGATFDAVELMAETVDGRLGVKASGGIRTVVDALAMIDAGATRLGTSATAQILDDLDAL
jgi:deoxyribose-phosphate aldolase